MAVFHYALTFESTDQRLPHSVVTSRSDDNPNLVISNYLPSVIPP